MAKLPVSTVGAVKPATHLRCTHPWHIAPAALEGGRGWWRSTQVSSLAEPEVRQGIKEDYLIKLVMVLATASGAGNRSFPYSITVMIHAMFLPKTSMICFPSPSCSISPGLRPWATFQ